MLEYLPTEILLTQSKRKLHVYLKSINQIHFLTIQM